MTQLEAARKGKITEEMAYVAEKEGVSPEFVREGVAAGRIVIPRNPNHKTLTDFKGIGEGLSVKVNANLGTSYDYVDVEEEVEKARVAIQYGADTVMDLSTGGDLKAIRKRILEVALAQTEVEARSMRELVHETFEHIEALFQNKGATAGVRTGFKELDQLIGTLEVVAGRELDRVASVT